MQVLNDSESRNMTVDVERISRARLLRQLEEPCSRVEPSPSVNHGNARGDAKRKSPCSFVSPSGIQNQSVRNLKEVSATETAQNMNTSGFVRNHRVAPWYSIVFLSLAIVTGVSGSNDKTRTITGRHYLIDAIHRDVIGETLPIAGLEVATDETCESATFCPATNTWDATFSEQKTPDDVKVEFDICGRESPNLLHLVPGSERPIDANELRLRIRYRNGESSHIAGVWTRLKMESKILYISPNISTAYFCPKTNVLGFAPGNRGERGLMYGIDCDAQQFAMGVWIATPPYDLQAL